MVEDISIKNQLHNLAENIFSTYSFSSDDVIYILDPDENMQNASCHINKKPITIIVGIKDYLIADKIEEDQKIYFQNSLLHECEHAKTQVLLPEVLRGQFEKSKLSFAFWAFKLLDEYKAYTYANEKFKQETRFLQGTELEILKIIVEYGNRPKTTNVSLEKCYEYAESYYYLGSAFIAHKCVNPEFPSIKEDSYLIFLNDYFNHLKEASKQLLDTYDDYVTLSKTLLKDFELLIECVQKLNPELNTICYNNFIDNAHMI